ncbi:MAG: sugar ABC transporter permease [Polyangiaceae bacterium]|nr:sugar ABC transporter permease [Polyangiaceae bacterium]
MRPRHPLHPYWMLAPTLLVIGLFFLYPLCVAAKDSFYRWDLLTEPEYAGFENYTRLARSGELVGVVGRTVTFGLVVVGASTALGLALAILLNRRGRVYAFFRSAIFSAYVVSWVAVALLWMWILDADAGVVSRAFRAVGIPTMNWLGDPRSALYAIAFVTVWKITGYAMVVYLAGLQAIPPTLFEAAALDGAGPMRRFIHVTWPSLRPTTAFVASTGLIMSFQAFDVVRVMTQGGPVRSTTLFVYAIYEEIFVNLRVGRASALVMVFFVILILLTVLNLWAFRAGRRMKEAT